MVTVFARQLRCHRVLRRADPIASSAISLTVGFGGSDLVGELKLVKWIKGSSSKYFGRHQTL
jgi:hypothetical protein